ncbi:hypothetical protein [Brucella pseudogrignonensis]|uniref:hypothetical protein n=1 Tax=Brucella pseudogrignonensis TaxID=419475 RepID=UPI000ACE99A8|nr:hypothetical protein [Brucella pseudogrignonensis]
MTDWMASAFSMPVAPVRVTAGFRTAADVLIPLRNLISATGKDAGCFAAIGANHDTI